MKILILILTVFSAIAYSQVIRSSDFSAEDSLAAKNVKSILNYSKKSFFNSGTDLSKKSEIQYNVNQLLINKNSFNTVNGGSYGDYTSPWMLSESRINKVNTQVRTVLSVPIYKSK